MFSCEQDPEIQMDGFQTQPVIYSIIETFDSINYVRIGRFYSGYSNPAVTAKYHDSIYFSDPDLKVTLFRLHGLGIEVPVEKVRITDKNRGFFNSDDYYLYAFKEVLVKGDYPYYYLPFENISLEVALPGLPPAKCITNLVTPPLIWAPMRAQQYVFILPDDPLRILWSGGDWNEIDVSFQVREEYPDTTQVRTFSIQKNNDIHINGKYYEIKIPYELIIEILEKNLKVRSDLVRRYFGFFRIEILTGNLDFANYKKYLDGINDFNFNAYNTVTNGIGLLAAKSTAVHDSLCLDWPSRQHFAEDPVLKKFSFIEY